MRQESNPCISCRHKYQDQELPPCCECSSPLAPELRPHWEPMLEVIHGRGSLDQD
ncbi:MAG: hypothetical protein ACOC43_10010 [Desulfohalobiaceae bacterium]